MIGTIPSWTLVALLSFPILSEAQTSTVTVLFNSSTVSVTEGSTVGIQLIVQGTYDRGFSVNLTFLDGSARLVRDYLYPGYPTLTPSVTFSPGSLSSSVFNVIAIGNNAFDPRQRSFTVGFELPNVPGLHLRRGRPDRLSVSITDDNFVDVCFKRPTQKVYENVECIPVRLKSRGIYSRPFQVSFTCVEIAPVEAENGEDFISKVHTVTFDTVGTSESMSSNSCVPILDDRISESTESFICVILRPHGVDGIVVKDPNTILFTICDDDNLKVRFEQDSYMGEEGSTVTNIRLLASDFAEPFQVQIFVFTLNADAPEKEMEANINVDYTDPQAMLGSGEVSFDPALGSVSTSLTIPLFCDNIVEGTEYFGLTFVAVTDETEDNPVEIIPVEPTQVLVAIKDNNEVEIYIDTTTYLAPEGNPDVPCPVRLSAPYPHPIPVTIELVSLDGVPPCKLATGGEDFVDIFPVDVVVPANTTILEASFTLIDDNVTECDEAFGFALVYKGSQPCVSLRPGSSSGNLTIVDDDVHTLVLRFKNTSYSVREDAGSVSIRLEAVQEDPDNPGSYIPANYTAVCEVTCSTVAGSAEAEVDYIPTRGKVEFSSGMQLSTPFQVDIVDNEILECPEEFTVKCSISEECTDRVQFLNSDRTTVSIIDDQDALVRFAAPRIDVYEGTKISVQVYRVGRIQQQLTIRVQAEQDTARRGLDFRLRTKSLVFNKLESNVEVKNVIVNIKEDNLSEGSENFSIVLDSGSGSPCSQQKLPVTILEV